MVLLILNLTQIHNLLLKNTKMSMVIKLMMNLLILSIWMIQIVTPMNIPMNCSLLVKQMINAMMDKRQWMDLESLLWLVKVVNAD